MSASIIAGDCRVALARLPENLVDAVVTDPPYHLTSIVKRFGKEGSAPAKQGIDGRFSRLSRGFMGKVWDGGDISMRPDTWAAILRVMKPGAHLLAFGGTRTHHRIWCAIEDAGFEIRDTVMWLYGSGFPKSHNDPAGLKGWGTALKPAWEPICLARKPLVGTVAANVQEFGTGALNIDECRIEGVKDTPTSPRRAAQNATYGDLSKDPGTGSGWDKNIGRWPANVCHDGSEEVLAAFPEAPGQQRYVGPEHGDRLLKGIYGDFGPRPSNEPRGDSGSAARFFYCAKASRGDRDEGCNDLPDSLGGIRSETSGQHITRRDGGDPKAVKNNHPTVKPTELMRYCCRLVTPQNGLILDPFMGSGSTGKAALKEGFCFLGIEKEDHYVEIARRRIGGDITVHRLKT